MDQLQNPNISRLVAFVAGAAAHLFLFRYGEWDLWTVRLIGIFTLLNSASVAILLKLPFTEPFTPLAAVHLTGTHALCLLSGIWGSMLVYRGFFHRLARFPGPFLARFSNFYVTSLSAKNLHLYEEVEKLHQQYGDIVRLGPSELSINSAEALTTIHSAQSNCTKGPWYNVLHPMVSLQLIRNKPEHIQRRRVWDRGFSAKALREYEPRVVGYADQLLTQMEKRAGSSVDMTTWFNFYSFDVMGDLAWGKSFDMAKNGVKHYFMKSLHADMTNIGLFSHLLWLFPIFKSTPILNYEHKRFWVWMNTQVAERKNMKPDRPDVFTPLLEEYRSKPQTYQGDLNLTGDAYLIAVAGSDTTAATLTCLFYELTMNPDKLATLQEEVDEVFKGSEAVDSLVLGKLPYLNATINETLRLHPPVPSGVQRVTPPEGLTIGSTFIPGNTIVQVPSYTLQKDERYFVKPKEFIPERWTSRPELVIDASAFAPFSLGRYSCIGKQLGLMEVRHVAAQIFRRYNLAFAPEQTSKAFLDDKRDTFTLALGPLNLVLSPRKQ